MSQLHFYAMGRDLQAVLELMEQRKKSPPVKYVRQGFANTLAFPIYRSFRDIPDLGRASASDWLSCPSYLILDANEKVGFEHKVFPDFERYGVYEGINPTGIDLSPSGAFGSDVVIYGRFATMGLTEQSKALFRRYTAALKKQFRRVDYAWVGQEAFQALQSGWKLAQTVDAPHKLSVKPLAE
jgi:hypothetical protein